MVALRRSKVRAAVILAKSIPGLKELLLEGCSIVLDRHSATSDSKFELEQLSLSCCSWSGCNGPPFLSPHLRRLNISDTVITDDDLQTIVSLSHS